MGKQTGGIQIGHGLQNLTSLAQGCVLSLDILGAWPSKRRNPTSSRRSAPSVKNRFHGEKSGKRIGQKFDTARRGAEISEEKTEYDGTVCSAQAYLRGRRNSCPVIGGCARFVHCKIVIASRRTIASPAPYEVSLDLLSDSALCRSFSMGPGLTCLNQSGCP